MKKLVLIAALLITQSNILYGKDPNTSLSSTCADERAVGYHKFKFGDLTITALYDGQVDLGIEMLNGLEFTDHEKLISMTDSKTGKLPTSVNAFLISDKKQNILVDTGTANFFGPSLGKLLCNLERSGTKSASVSSILITHLHPDHIGGLSNIGVNNPFPKTRIYVHQEEIKYWLGESSSESLPPMLKPFVSMIREALQHHRTNGLIKAFDYESTLVMNIKPLPAFGHTPGHTAFEITSNKKSFVILGDLIHSHSLQFAKPTIAIEFDSDRTAAIENRISILEYTAKKNSLVAGMHLPFPGIGYVDGDRNNGFKWRPVERSTTH